MNRGIDSVYSGVRELIRQWRLNKHYRAGNIAREFCEKNAVAQLTKDEIERIDDYWKQFGIRFRDYSFHRMYYSVTGKKDPRFIPDPLAGLVIYPYYNDMGRVKAYADKNLFPWFLPDVCFPRTYAQRINKHYYDSDHRYYGTELSDAFINRVFQEIRSNHASDIIIKETTDTNTGKGVKKHTVHTSDDLKKALTSSNSINFIVQECVRQHAFFQQFNSDSVNIIRLNTWRTDNEIMVFAPCIRFGIPGSATDVSYVDGKEIVQCVGIHDGRAADHYFTLDGDRKPLHILDRDIPRWDEVLKTVKNAHLEMDYFGIIAWDVIVDSHEHVICIEYNLKWPGTVVYQFAHGPFAGEKTDEYLGFLRDPAMQKLLPPCIRL